MATKRRAPVRPANTNGVEPFGREQVAGIQRARILMAMVQVACERGGGELSVAHVVDRAGVSRRTFYELFSSCEDCFLAAFDDAVDRIASRVVPSWDGDGRWHERMRSSLMELLAFCEEQPLLARFVFVESLAGGSKVMARRTELQAVLTTAVDEGRGETVKAANPGPLTAEGVVGAVSSVLSTRLSTVGVRTGAHPDLLRLTGSLMSLIVLPYMGAATAQREAQRPVPTRTVHPNANSDRGLVLRDVRMRLTYRTVRALTAVAQHPGASNRFIGTTAGMEDQGQISKLLNRLERIGLLENTGVSSGKGAPNSWVLTEKGRRVTEAIHPAHEPGLAVKGEGAMSAFKAHDKHGRNGQYVS